MLKFTKFSTILSPQECFIEDYNTINTSEYVTTLNSASITGINISMESTDNLISLNLIGLKDMLEKYSETKNKKDANIEASLLNYIVENVSLIESNFEKITTLFYFLISYLCDTNPVLISSDLACVFVNINSLVKLYSDEHCISPNVYESIFDNLTLFTKEGIAEFEEKALITNRLTQIYYDFISRQLLIDYKKIRKTPVLAINIENIRLVSALNLFPCCKKLVFDKLKITKNIIRMIVRFNIESCLFRNCILIEEFILKRMISKENKDIINDSLLFGNKNVNFRSDFLYFYGCKNFDLAFDLLVSDFIIYNENENYKLNTDNKSEDFAYYKFTVEKEKKCVLLSKIMPTTSEKPVVLDFSTFSTKNEEGCCRSQFPEVLNFKNLKVLKYDSEEQLEGASLINKPINSSIQLLFIRNLSVSSCNFTNISIKLENLVSLSCRGSFIDLEWIKVITKFSPLLKILDIRSPNMNDRLLSYVGKHMPSLMILVTNIKLTHASAIKKLKNTPLFIIVLLIDNASSKDEELFVEVCSCIKELITKYVIVRMNFEVEIDAPSLVDEYCGESYFLATHRRAQVVSALHQSIEFVLKQSENSFAEQKYGSKNFLSAWANKERIFDFYEIEEFRKNESENEDEIIFVGECYFLIMDRTIMKR